ncbi:MULTISPECIES: hypothetical protein [unclassified Pedobacter]|nr:MULTISPECIES: hypothetical protein [unclassified Pedobacter]QXU42197.1 hypothetical protein KYH19_00925 [Pedobacter sp. D749]
MEIIVLRNFLNDIKKLNDKKSKDKIKEFIMEIENAESLEELPSIKK